MNKKPELVRSIGDPLFMILRAAKNAESKINQVCDWFYYGKSFYMVKQYSYRYNIADTVLSRIVRDKPMLIDDFNDLADRVYRRYGSSNHPYMQGCLVVFLDDRLKIPTPMRIRDEEYNLINTHRSRMKAREKYKKKPKEYQDVQCLLEELQYITAESTKRNLIWETKLPKLERLAMCAN